jgi:hypothetical protein
MPDRSLDVLQNHAIAGRRSAHPLGRRQDPRARVVLNQLLEKFTEYGAMELRTEALRVQPFTDIGNIDSDPICGVTYYWLR